nr:FRG domain-containing protein [Conexibacter arvalis]
MSLPTGVARWFRGQGCASRRLQPSLVRKLAPFDSARLLETELRLITRFRQRSLPLWPEGYPQRDWEQLFAMQHFGVPTRLLDWSENALVGAYFAASHQPTQCECGTGSCRPTLWVLDPVRLNRLNPRLDGYGEAIRILATSDAAIDSWAPGIEDARFAPWPVALFGTHNSARIVAQQGTFTVAGKNDTAMEDSPAVVTHSDVLEKICIDDSQQNILNGLKLLGITRSAVFPDLAGVGQDIAEAEMN